MDLSDSCVKDLQTAVDLEVRRQTIKMKTRMASLENNARKQQQNADNLKRELESAQKTNVGLVGRVEGLEDELHRAKATLEALQDQLAARTPRETAGKT